MARGWESKSIESQQDEARQEKARPAAGPASPEDRAQQARRRVLELARARTAADLTRATAPAQRAMLERALADLDQTIGELGASSS
jgi:hypothetical protein